MIKRIGLENLYDVVELALLLWPHHSKEELDQEFTDILSDPNSTIFIDYEEGKNLGFCQCQLRFDYVEGTRSSPVGYLEGIFIREEYRRRGIGKKFLEHFEAWAKSCGCSELASDCELSNADSLNWHLKAGFNEANRIICFTKKIK
jgi:aminoglycoside 6'-N-acetyltransferase I